MDELEYSQSMLGNIVRNAIDCAYIREYGDCEEHYADLDSDFTASSRRASKSMTPPDRPADTWEKVKKSRVNVTILEHNGERMTIAQWASRLGVSKNSLEVRLMRGWSIERTLTTPLGPRGGRAKGRPAKVSQH